MTVRDEPRGPDLLGGGRVGTVSGANVTSVAVTCTTIPTYSVGGSVTGLSGTVVLRNNGGDDLSVSCEWLVQFRDAVAGTVRRTR